MTPRERWNRSWLVAVLLLLAVATYQSFHRITPVPLPTDLRLLPMSVGTWQGEDIDPLRQPLRAPGAHEELARTYRDPAGRTLDLYVAYFESQEQGRELVTYLSKPFYKDAVQVRVAPDPTRSFTINRVILAEARGRRVLLFWYDLNGRIVADPYHSKLLTVLDAITRGRTNGAIVALSLHAPQLPPATALSEDERTALRDLFPAIRRHLHSEAT